MSAPTAPLTDNPSRNPLLAAFGIAASAILVAFATFADIGGNDPGESDQGLPEYLFAVGVIVITAAMVFGLVVRTAPQGDSARRALVLGVGGFLSNAVFWAGMNCVLAAGAIACALTYRDTHRRLNGTAKAGLALGVLTLVPAVVLAVVG